MAVLKSIQGERQADFLFFVAGALLVLAGAVVAWPVKTPRSVSGQVLETGVFWGGGSRYILIAEQEGRICYEGRSPNGSMVRPLALDPKTGILQSAVTPAGEPIRLISIAPGHFRMGGFEYVKEGDLVVSAAMRACLESPTPENLPWIKAQLDAAPIVTMLE